MKRPKLLEQDGTDYEYIVGYNRGLADERTYNEKEMQWYYGLANIACAFVDLKPEHKLYESIRQDLKHYINKVRGEKC